MRIIVTDRDLAVMDEAVEALFRAEKNVHAVALGAVALRLRGQISSVVFSSRDDDAPLATVHELHGYSQRVDSA